MTWKFGAASVDITPETPQFLMGYIRHSKSTGVYHPIYAKALYMTDGREEAALIAADIGGFFREVTARYRKAIRRACGLAPDHVVLSATHTHCAPTLTPKLRMGGSSDPAYIAFLEDRLVEAVRRAKAAARPGRVEFSRVRSSWGVNRRPREADQMMAVNPEGTHDRAVDTRWFLDNDGALIASATSYGCHPTAHKENLADSDRVGADYPGFFKDVMEKKTGAIALWSQGCGGSVRPWFSGNLDDFGGRTLEAARRMGEGHAKEVLAGRKGAMPVELGALRASHTTTQLPLREMSKKEAFDLNWPLRKKIYTKADIQRGLDENWDVKAIPFETQVLSLNPRHHLVYWGGEVVSEIGYEFKNMTPGHIVTPHGYTNNVTSYIPSENMALMGGYEVERSHFFFGLPRPVTIDAQRHLWRAAWRLIEKHQPPQDACAAGRFR